MKKSKLIILLCTLLTATLVLTACGDKTDFLQTLKTVAEMERFEYSMTANVKISSDQETEELAIPIEKMEIVVSGFMNDAANGKTNLTFKVVSGGTTVEQELGDILIIDNVVYMDLSAMTKLMGIDNSMLPEGKSILKVEDFSGVGGEVSTSASVEAANTAIKDLLVGFADMLEKSAKDVSPEVFYKDGEKYCFSLSKDNGTAFLHNLGNALKSDFPEIYEGIVSALKNSEDEDNKLFGEELEETKGDLLLSISSAADELLAVEDADFEGISFLASTTLTGKKGSHAWTMDLDTKVEESSVKFGMTMTEYTEAKELSVDQEKVITMEEYMQALASSFGGFDYGTVA